MTPDAPTPTPTPAAKTKHPRGPVNQAHADELELAQQLVAVARKDEYADALGDEAIDAAFLTDLTTKLTAANRKLGSAGGKTVSKQTVTRQEENLQKALLEKIEAIQHRAKRKYSALGDPQRAKYFIGQDIASRRAVLEASTRALIQTLAGDTLPGLKPTDAAGLQTALDAYVAAETDQSSDQADATGDRVELEAMVKAIAGLRRQIQYAADTRWPASHKANAAIRKEFKIPADRSMK